MFVALMELLEKHSRRLAAGIMGDIRKREEARRAAGFEGGESPARMSGIYDELLGWLFDNLRKGNLVAYYSSLGGKPLLKGARLEEVVTAILVVQKEIMAIVIDEIDGQGDLSLSQTLDIVFRVNLFFDLVMHSVNSGCRQEPALAMFDSAGEPAGLHVPV